MELQAVTGQLVIINGQVQAPTGHRPTGKTTTPGLLVQSAPPKATRSRRRDILFVHLTLSGQIDETAVLAQDLLDLISRHFYQATGSITAALRQAITEANQRLLRLNLEDKGPTRVGAISCAALHDGELFLLQAGEGLAFLGHNFGVERLPAEPSAQATPLGRSAGLHVRYFHHRLQNGNLLLLADPRISNLTAEALAPALVDTDVESGLLALPTAVGPQATARLLLIEFTTDEIGDEIGDATVIAASEPVAAAVTPTPVAATPVVPTANPLAATFPQPIRESDQTTSPTPRRATAERPSPTSASVNQIAADVQTSARKTGAAAAFGLANFTDWLTDMLLRLRPPRPEDDEPTNWAIPATIAIIVPLLVAIIVTSVYLERGRVRRFAELKTEMGQEIGLADGADSRDQARQSYDRVILLADEADALRAGDGEISRLRQQAMTALDQLDGVSRLQARQLYEFTSDIQLTDVVLQGGFDGGVFTLDSSSNVYFHASDASYLNLSGAPTQIVFSGKALGSHVVGKVVDMTWRPAGTAVSRAGLAMLDSKGALLTYFPNMQDTRVAPLGLSSVWQIATALAFFNERLYILDPGAREIWKYFPDSDGFLIKDDEQVLVLDSSADLNAAVDLDLYSEDGSLLLLYGDGRLRYYDTRSGRVQWDEAELLKNGGLTIPLVSPTAAQLVGRGLNASIFVADPGSGRILQIARGGRVIAQYRATNEAGTELFSHVQGFAVAEAPLRIFITDGSKLYVATQN
ncbi:MAG: hypothetical protein IPM39_17215 [Chloroflexi bacterium]|nr:hypothetical protein [Chloroflexota bacterium]